MTKTTLRIRQAVETDLDDMVQMLSQAWRESHSYDESVFAQHEEQADERLQEWRDDMRLGVFFWIVIDLADDERIVGLSRAGLARDEEPATALELWIMYLLDVVKGTGVADALLKMSVGDSAAQLWVPEDSDRALAFYRRHGFAADGSVREPITGRRELRMVRTDSE